MGREYTPLVYLQALHRLTDELLRITDLDAMLQHLVDETAELLQAPYSEILLLEADGALVVHACTAIQEEIKGERVYRPDAKLTWQAFDSGQPAVLDDYATWEHRRSVYSDNLHAVMDVPIMTANGPIGVLALGRTQPDQPFLPIEIEEGKLLAQAIAAVLEKSAWRDRVASAEARTRQSNQRMLTLLEMMREPVSLIDRTNRIQYTSPAYQDTLGYRSSDLVGRDLLDIVHPDDRDGVRAFLTQTLTEDPDITGGLIEFRCLHANGHPVWVESSATPIYDENGLVTGILTVFRDIAERRQIEALKRERELLAATLRKEQELSHLKGAMMVRIEHEFRTPLAVLQLNTELLIRYLERMSLVQRQERIQTIQGQVAHLTSMLDGIRDVFKIGSATQPPALHPLDITALCSALIGQMNEQRSQPITFRRPEAPVIALSDETLLTLALQQVLLNAVHYSQPDSPLTVELLVEPKSIVIHVTDTGIGFVPEDLHRVFEPFFRGSNINERGGLGIGLTLARDAIQALRGSIAIHSQPDQGTTVTLSIPCIERGAAEEP
jgi:PAS domain S-box-containing protein